MPGVASGSGCHGEHDKASDGFVERESEDEETREAREDKPMKEDEGIERRKGKMFADINDCPSNSENESEDSALSSATTTTSYLHGDGKTVQKLVARTLRKKYHHQQQKARPRKDKTMTSYNKTKKNKGKKNIKLGVDSEW